MSHIDTYKKIKLVAKRDLFDIKKGDVCTVIDPNEKFFIIKEHPGIAIRKDCIFNTFYTQSELRKEKLIKIQNV